MSFKTYIAYVLLVLVTALTHACTKDVDNNSNQEIKASAVIAAKHLINVKQLIERQNDLDNSLLVEVSNPKIYKEGHIPNAHNIWRPAFETDQKLGYTGMKASKKKLQESLQNIGLSKNQNLILYDKKGGSDAMRLAWLLHLNGFDEYKILDGGYKDWKLKLNSTSTEIPKIEKGDFTFDGTENHETYIDFEEMKKAVKDKKYLIVDTREPEEYYGKPFYKKGHVYSYKRGAFTHGTIPGAIHFNWSESVDMKKDDRIKSLKDLKYNFEKAGITPDKDIILFCHSGSRSSHTTYVLKNLLNYPKVRNYDGSWIEWSHHYTKGEDIEIMQLTSDSEHSVLKDKLNSNSNN